MKVEITKNFFGILITGNQEEFWGFLAEDENLYELMGFVKGNSAPPAAARFLRLTNSCMMDYCMDMYLFPTLSNKPSSQQGIFVYLPLAMVMLKLYREHKHLLPNGVYLDLYISMLLKAIHDSYTDDDFQKIIHWLDEIDYFDEDYEFIHVYFSTVDFVANFDRNDINSRKKYLITLLGELEPNNPIYQERVELVAQARKKRRRIKDASQEFIPANLEEIIDQAFAHKFEL